MEMFRCSFCTAFKRTNNQNPTGSVEQHDQANGHKKNAADRDNIEFEPQRLAVDFPVFSFTVHFHVPS